MDLETNKLIKLRKYVTTDYNPTTDFRLKVLGKDVSGSITTKPTILLFIYRNNYFYHNAEFVTSIKDSLCTTQQEIYKCLKPLNLSVHNSPVTDFYAAQ
ncbi:unnamed protein product [Schistosoma curassoni]|nr:unnamed protein product [Schistosoma curassoni]